MNILGLITIALIVSVIVYAVKNRKGKSGKPSGFGSTAKEHGRNRPHNDHENQAN